MKRVCLAIAILTTTAAGAQADPAAAIADAESQRVAVINKVKDCVLAVFSPNGQGGGSGVVISPDGYALSNFHVVLPCGRAMQCGMADGKIYDAVVVGIDPTGDVALVKLFGRDNFPCAALGDSDQVRAGDWVFAMGNPFLLATDLQPTVTYGIVSGVHRYQFPSGTLLEYTDCLQVDASINPGNSGGPLFDAQGRLIGINGRASFEKRGRVNVGAAYAISINQIKNFLGTLHSGRIVDHATLGARVGADADGRVVVTDILETSDAYRRGLRYDDEIISFGGRPVSTPNGFKNVLGIFPKGWRVPLSYRRDGRRHDILVRLAGIHSQEDLLAKASGRPPAELMPIPKPGEGPKSGPHGGKPRGGRPCPPSPTAPQRAHARNRQETLRGETRLRQLLLQCAPAAASLEGMERRGKPGRCQGVWTLTGQLQQGGAFRFQLTDDGAVAETARRRDKMDRRGPTGRIVAAGPQRRIAARTVSLAAAGRRGTRPLWAVGLLRYGAAGRARRIGRRAGRRAQGRGMPFLLRPGRGTPIGAGNVSRRGQLTPVKSIFRTTTRWPDGFGPGGSTSAMATNCLRRSR